MNKRRFIIVTLLVAAAVSVAVVSCKKSNETTDSSSLKNEQFIESNMDEYLTSFKNKLLSAQKGDETIGLEQAQSDLGNLLNFDFGDVNYATNEFRYDTLHFKLALSNGLVDLSQLAVTYNEIIASIIETYNKIDLPEKSVYAIICRFNEVASKENETEDVEIVLITRGYSNFDFYPHDTLDWRPKNHAGTCDGQYVNQYGAPEILQIWVTRSNYAMFWSCPNGGRLYFTEIDNPKIYGSQTYDPVAGRYRIYTSTDLDQDNICITHEEMEYYYSQILYYWNHGGFPHASDHRIIGIYITHCALYDYYTNEFQCYTWEVMIRHGKPNCTDGDPLV